MIYVLMSDNFVEDQEPDIVILEGPTGEVLSKLYSQFSKIVDKKRHMYDDKLRPYFRKYLGVKRLEGAYVHEAFVKWLKTDKAFRVVKHQTWTY